MTETFERGDADSYTIEANAGDTVWVQVGREPADDGPVLYADVRFYDPTGKDVNRGHGKTNVHLREPIERGGIHTLLLNDASTSHEGTGDYVIHHLRLPGPAEHGTLAGGAAVSGEPTRAATRSSAFRPIAKHLDRMVMRWAMRKHKRLRGHYLRNHVSLSRVRRERPDLFAHWSGRGAFAVGVVRAR